MVALFCQYGFILFFREFDGEFFKAFTAFVPVSSAFYIGEGDGVERAAMGTKLQLYTFFAFAAMNDRMLRIGCLVLCYLMSSVAI